MAGHRFKLQGRLRKTLQSRYLLMTPRSAPEENHQLSTIARPTTYDKEMPPSLSTLWFLPAISW